MMEMATQDQEATSITSGENEGVQVDEPNERTESPFLQQNVHIQLNSVNRLVYVLLYYVYAIGLVKQQHN